MRQLAGACTAALSLTTLGVGGALVEQAANATRLEAEEKIGWCKNFGGDSYVIAGTIISADEGTCGCPDGHYLEGNRKWCVEQRINSQRAWDRNSFQDSKDEKFSKLSQKDWCWCGQVTAQICQRLVAGSVPTPNPKRGGSGMADIFKAEIKNGETPPSPCTCKDDMVVHCGSKHKNLNSKVTQSFGFEVPADGTCKCVESKAKKDKEKDPAGDKKDGKKKPLKEKEPKKGKDKVDKPLPEVPKKKRNNTFGFVCIGFVLVLLVAIGLFFVYRSRRKDEAFPVGPGGAEMAALKPPDALAVAGHPGHPAAPPGPGPMPPPVLPMGPGFGAVPASMPSMPGGQPMVMAMDQPQAGMPGLMQPMPQQQIIVTPPQGPAPGHPMIMPQPSPQGGGGWGMAAPAF